MAPLCALMRLWLALSASLWAGGGRAAAPTLYQTPSAQWTAVMLAPVQSFAARSDSPLAVIGGLPAELQRQALAPLVYQLGRSLHLKPAEFALLDAASKASALELAAEEARADLVLRTYGLVAQSKTMVWGKQDLDHQGLADLRRTAAQLQEVHRHYGAFLHADEKQTVEQAAAQSSARYLEARARFVERLGLETAQALSGRAPRADPPEQPGVDAPATTLSFSPNANAVKLYEQMKRSRAGWGQRDMQALFEGFGFAYRDDGPHRVYFHPVFRSIRPFPVSRLNELKPYFAQEAVKRVEQAEALRLPAPAPALVSSQARLEALVELPSLPSLPTAKPFEKKPVTIARPLAEALAPAPAPKPQQAQAEREQEAGAVVAATPRIPAVVEAAPLPVAISETKPAQMQKTGVLNWLRRVFSR